MKVMAVVSMVLALGACAEVTKFHKADGSTYYFVNCDNTLRWVETCRFAARRTCPNGYAPIAVTSIALSSDDAPYARCLEENQDLVDQGLPASQCEKTRRNESYFTCK